MVEDTARSLTLPTLTLPRLLLKTMSVALKSTGASLKLKLSVAVWPLLSFARLLVIASVGATVSMLIAGDAPAPPRLPAASVVLPAVTVMLAVPAARLAVGVKVAVRTRPLLLTAPSVPPETTMSALPKLASGSSLKLKLIVAVSPALSTDLLLVIVTVAGVVSTL